MDLNLLSVCLWLFLWQSIEVFGLVQVHRFNINNNNKECNQTTIETCSNRLIMLGDRTFVFPETLEQMNKRCKELKPLERCVKDYTTKCLPHASSSTISVLTYSITRTNRGYCSNSRRKMSFVVWGKCANENKKALDQYVDKMYDEINSIISYKNPKLRIPLVCCSFYSFKSKVINNVLDHCKQYENEIQALMNGYTNDILDLICGEYTEDSDKCSRIVGKIANLKAPAGTKRTSFLYPLADVFESL